MRTRNVAIIVLACCYSTIVLAQDPPAGSSKGSDQVAQPTAAGAGSSEESGDSSSSNAAAKHAQLLKGAKAVEGVIQLYQKENQLFAELSGGDYSAEFMVLISIARGIGQDPLLGGMSWGFGDDWVWSFRKIGENVQIVRKNVRFRADKNSPEATAVKYAYTDSVLFSLPVATKGPKGGDLVDLTPVFMSDLPQISQVLPGFAFSPQKSVWEDVKGFKDNVELEVAATYASSGTLELDSVPDSRGVTINVHYSISKIPQTDYQPRLADDRVGYFLTVVKDYSKKGDDDRFVRFINRWNLQKADRSLEKSVPKEPVIFWVEKTVPFRYRKAIFDGINEWNRAFEQAGFINAVEVRQQPDDASWDPEDINYNTFRWITSSAGFAMGPSRVNPYTGEILDADIIFDADFIESWKRTFETFTPATVESLTGGPLDLESYRRSLETPLARVPDRQRACVLSQGMAMEFALGQTAIMAESDPAKSAELQEKLIMQGLKEVAMHEVGHTLGLRHNFKASTLLTLEEMRDPEKTKADGLLSSVMDYAPAFIAPPGEEQGDFFSTTIGPYDRWAIEYGYKQLDGGTQGEVKELQKIAARSGEKELAYATDEDTRGIDPDPFSNRFDLGKDPLKYATMQAELVGKLMPGIVDRMTKEGDDYSRARSAFNVLLANQSRALHFASRFIGGLDVSRSHKGDEGAKPPFTVIEPDQQREALKLLETYVFSDKPYQVDPSVYNHLAPSHWNHWGENQSLRSDFPVHQMIEMWQMRIIGQLMSSLTLERLHDSELKRPQDQDAFTTAELIESLSRVIFAELHDLPAGEYSNRKPAISSLRRNLQRNYLTELSYLALGRTAAPRDCQAVAYDQLANLQKKMAAVQEQAGLDTYTRAHLRSSSDRIQKVLDASMTLTSP